MADNENLPNLIFVIPNGTVIPARGHFLGVNGDFLYGYSLASYATGDATYTMNIPDNSDFALFTTANAANFTADHVLDTVGFTGALAPFFEGTPLPAIDTSDGQYSFVRKTVTTAGVPRTGRLQDTNSNADDFLLISTHGCVGTLSEGSCLGTPAVLGAPGPENLSSPIQRNAQIRATLLEPALSPSDATNRRRYRCTDPDRPTDCDANPNTSPLGYLSIRRTYTNLTGQPVTRLRFRVVDISTTPEGTGPSGNNIADLRALSRSGSFTVASPLSTYMVRGLMLEQSPNQPLGGGFNASLALTLATPLAAVDDPNTWVKENQVMVEFLLGIVQTGNFRFFVNVEAAP